MIYNLELCIDSDKLTCCFEVVVLGRDDGNQDLGFRDDVGFL